MSTALCILARYPRLGKVKTRLQKLLGPAGCLELHRALILDTVERTARIEGELHLFLADCTRAEALRFGQQGGLPPRLELHLQQGPDLGRRMWNAYCEVRSRTKRAVFLGSDAPSVPLAYLREASSRLRHLPVVLGPARDGGYYLLALAEERRDLFEGISWGTSAVLEQTQAKLGRQYHLLPPWYDVDTPQDLERLRQDLGSPFEGFPHRTSRILAAPSRHA